MGDNCEELELNGLLERPCGKKKEQRDGSSNSSVRVN